MILAAIDPGAAGAIAIFRAHDLADVRDMPLGRHVGWQHRLPDARAVADHLEDYAVDRVLIETIQPRPGNGVATIAASAASWGVLLGATCWLRVELVPPQRWTKALGVGSDKDVHRAAAKNLYGGTWFDRKRDDGRADAVLIGHWWLTGRGAKGGAA